MDFPQTPIMRLFSDIRGNTIWIKRDDLLPFSFGGNKARIAHELLEDMEAQGRNHMIAYGNARSNLCRALSNLCAAQDVPCTVLSPADDDGSRELSYNLLLSQAFGAEIVPCQKTNVAQAVDRALANSKERGLKPYYIYGDRTGGGNLQTPVRAYRKVWRELQAQQAGLGVRFDQLYLASGTGMTQAGLLCGQAELGGDTQVIGISIARNEASGKAHIRDYLRATLGRDDMTVDFVDSYSLSYGQYSAEIADCARQTMTKLGIPLDMTYTGKAYYGMLRELKRRNVRGKQILFLHTGGTPLFFDKAAQIMAMQSKEAEQ